MPWLRIGAAGAFFGFALVCAVGAAFVAATVPETKGLRLDEVEALFRAGTAVAAPSSRDE